MPLATNDHPYSSIAASRRRDVPTLRPQTADAGTRHSKLSRMSFFEAFAIDAGDDTFAFPKPSSAKTTPKGIEMLASVASSREASPMIGVALGSPSHPPLCWTRTHSFGPGSANATPRTPRFTEFFDTQSPMETLTPDSARPQSTTAWKKVGSLFRRATKSIKNDSKTAAKPPPRPTGMPAIAQPTPRPKSRGRMSFKREKKKELYGETWPVDSKIDLGWNHVVRATEITVSSAQWTDSSRPSETDDTSLDIITPATCETSTPSTIPRLELQLPSCQLERYSVMFEKLLDPKPSLLERRRSRLLILDMSTSDTSKTQDITHLTPLAEDSPERVLPTRRSTAPALSPSLSVRYKAQPSKSTAFHRPLHLQRSNTTPLPEGSPLRTEFGASIPSQVQTLFDSPVSSEEDEPVLPHTPPHSASIDIVRVVTDAVAHLEVQAQKEAANVWQSVLPVPPASTTSSRFSIDVHTALDSPRLPSRSHSFNGKDNTPRPHVRHVHVAVARKVSVSHAAQLGDRRSFKPKVVQVRTQPHSRKTSVLDTNDGIL
ncbi:hypothetical protein AMS68_000799 [Peltaster fructicola]|uniref:Uncharacterized protein n=1 Tax=Peltaster fructicola TaxID=286661 RepID=A0A6H0XKM0_9PEZI|nr:hypothetical protein AMS68_000799 [Peltaster fructicola]